MAFDRKYTHRIRLLLMTQRNSDDVIISLDAMDHKLKKNADKFNWAIESIYNELKDSGCMMFHIILSMQDYYAPDWLIENIVSEANQKIIRTEMSREYHREDVAPSRVPDVVE